MKKIIFGTFFISLTLLVGAGCQNQTQLQNQEQQYTDILDVQEDGNTRVNNGVLKNNIDALPSEELSESEQAGLIYMREEEKLAHDVYMTLYEKWGQNIFNNIAQSEQTHTDAVKELLIKYNITDPVSNNEVGIFTNTDLQNLYDQLVTQGNTSLVEALNVGALVEEVDIVDIETYLEDVDNDDITLVYNNLLRGSRNHLRAFVKNISMNNETYTPQHITQTTFDEIVTGDTERGGVGYNNGQKNGSSGNGQKKGK